MLSVFLFVRDSRTLANTLHLISIYPISHFSATDTYTSMNFPINFRIFIPKITNTYQKSTIHIIISLSISIC